MNCSKLGRIHCCYSRNLFRQTTRDPQNHICYQMILLSGLALYMYTATANQIMLKMCFMLSRNLSLECLSCRFYCSYTTLNDTVPREACIRYYRFHLIRTQGGRTTGMYSLGYCATEVARIPVFCATVPFCEVSLYVHTI